MFGAVAGSAGDPDSGDGYWEKFKRLLSRLTARVRH
jgi:hypothetical protein